MKTFFSPVPVCRPALPSDRADVFEFTKFIWEGHDYIKYVWDEWLADPRGLLAVAEYAGHAVALGKASYITEGQWWLEGLRVDPKFQGQKIASHMFQYLEDWWKEHAGGTCRLMTSSERVQVHHMCARMGWDKIGDVRAYVAPALAGEPHDFRQVPTSEVDNALSFVSAHLEYCGGLTDFGWRFARPDRLLLDEQCRAARLWWRGDSVIGCWDDEDDGKRVMGLAFAACDIGAITTVLSGVRRLAAEQGFSSVLWHAPVHDDVLAAAEKAGFESQWPGSAFLFGKEL